MIEFYMRTDIYYRSMIPLYVSINETLYLDLNNTESNFSYNDAQNLNLFKKLLVWEE